MIARKPPNQFHYKLPLINEISVSIASEAAHIGALTVTRQPLEPQRGPKPRCMSDLGAKETWYAMCSLREVHQQELVMFMITHNTVHRFSLAEILLMLAINQIEAKRKARHR